MDRERLRIVRPHASKSVGSRTYAVNARKNKEVFILFDILKEIWTDFIQFY